MIVLKKVKDIVCNACAYSTMISIVFCIFVKVTSSLAMPAMLVSQYLVILLFGFFISCANLLFSIKSIPRSLVYLIHYLTLLVSFYVIFILISKSSFPTLAQLFITFVLYSFFYGLFFLCFYLIKRVYLKKSFTSKKENENNSYTPLYR